MRFLTLKLMPLWWVELDAWSLVLSDVLMIARIAFYYPFSSIASHLVSEGQQSEMGFAPTWISSWGELSSSHLLCQEAPSSFMRIALFNMWPTCSIHVFWTLCHCTSVPLINVSTLASCAVVPPPSWYDAVNVRVLWYCSLEHNVQHLYFNVGIRYFRIGSLVTRTRNTLKPN